MSSSTVDASLYAQRGLANFRAPEHYIKNEMTLPLFTLGLSLRSHFNTSGKPSLPPSDS